MSASDEILKSRLGESVEPLYKWPGGKRWLAPVLADVLRRELSGIYFEPFLGAGAVFMQLRPVRAVLGDINQEIVDCVRIIRRKPVVICKIMSEWKNNKVCYNRIRKLECEGEPELRAARFLYLMKTGWGGVYRLNQMGQFNVPYGRSGRSIVLDRKEFASNAGVFRNATLVCGDFEVLFMQASKGDVIYADPPYTTLGANNGFVRYNEKLFAWSDQERLSLVSHCAARRGVFVAVSGLWHQSVLDLYPNWWAVKCRRFSGICREFAKRKMVDEVVLFSRKPKVGDLRKYPHVVEGPLKVRSK